VFQTLKDLNALLTRRDRANLIVLVVLMFGNGLLEVGGLGLLFPYVSILQDLNTISDHRYAKAIYDAFGFTSQASFAIVISIGLLLVFAAKSVFGLWVGQRQIRFTYNIQSRLGRTLLEQYLAQPYTFFLAANTSTLIGNLTRSVSDVCIGAVQGTLMLATESLVLLWVVAFLIYLSPAFTLLAIAVITVIGGLFLRVVKSKIVAFGLRSDSYWKGMLRSANEGISAAKEIQVLDRAQYFVDNYQRQAESLAVTTGRYSLLNQLPRVTLEIGAVAGVVIFAVIALIYGQHGKDLFALLAVFALATIRVVPSANRILQAWNGINFNRAAIDIVRIAISDMARSVDKRPSTDLAHPSSGALRLRKSLSISVKSFSYSDNPRFGLRDNHVVIRQGESVAFIGHSGCGKTTLVDLVLGLFPDFDGEILADGQNIRNHLAEWRKQIGYIPQTIYLRDDTITRNIAFGLPDEQIDLDQVRRSASLAGLDSVIRSQPSGFDTVVGERGIRLSGGERQRIGIARALYHEPDLLILDEATSALDNETERRIVDSILGLSPTKTIIVIAHRLTTVKRCNVVYLMRDGCIIDAGAFNEISERHQDFVNPANVVERNLV
jgi:ATP-binding cassette, subfamily B, bacterial PglK